MVEIGELLEVSSCHRGKMENAAKPRREKVTENCRRRGRREKMERIGGVEEITRAMKRKDAQLQLSTFRAGFRNQIYNLRKRYFTEPLFLGITKWASTHPSVWTLGWPVPARQHPDHPGHRGCRAGWEEAGCHPLSPAWTVASTRATTCSKHEKIHTGRLSFSKHNNESCNS